MIDDDMFYKVWANMKSRCNNPKVPCYKNYGGRGIKVCKRWLQYRNFKKDMISSYKKGLSLERTDNNKGYSKNNCCWATVKEQANNRRSNRYITYKNKTKTLQQWSEYLGIKQSTLGMRFYVYKWNLNRCFNYVHRR